VTADEVVDIYSALEEVGIQLWIDGGWGVDALLGRQTRFHGDLDIAIQSKDLEALRSVLRSRGYREIQSAESNPWNFVLSDGSGREVDVHAFVFDEHGRVVEGIKYPDGSLTGVGMIVDRSVTCIAPEHLLVFRTQYEPRDKDRQDVAAICDKFGFENPFDAR
jgi:lincosamide nucleotidyltransferase A/C/D/E